MHLGFGAGSVAAECSVDGNVDPLVEGTGTGLLGFP